MEKKYRRNRTCSIYTLSEFPKLDLLHGLLMKRVEKREGNWFFISTLSYYKINSDVCKKFTGKGEIIFFKSSNMKIRELK